MEGANGKRVGNYVLTSKLGSGSFAIVFKGVHSQTQDVYAIKAISKEKVGLDSKAQSNLESEISIMRDYQHPNIVRLYEHFKSSRCIYLVLELCAGGDLSRFIKKCKRIEEKVAQGFLRQISEGLFFLSSRNLIHRDLKPANLLLTVSSNNATLKLSDFGFAKHLQEAALAQTPCGTPLYMAPEIFEHQEYDAKADIWSVGCIFYEMLVGTYPFRGRDTRELYNNIKSKSLSVPSDVKLSSESEVLLKRLLERNPLRRATLLQFYEACRFLPLTAALETSRDVSDQLVPEIYAARTVSNHDPIVPRHREEIAPTSSAASGDVAATSSRPPLQIQIDANIIMSSDHPVRRDLLGNAMADLRLQNGGGSKCEVSDDDYVVVEQATHPWRDFGARVVSHSRTPSLQVEIHNNNVSAQVPAGREQLVGYESGNDNDFAGLVGPLFAHCQFICELLMNVTAIADAFVRSALSSPLKSGGVAVERMINDASAKTSEIQVASACALYLHSLSILRQAMQQTLHAEQSLRNFFFDQRNRWIDILVALKKDMLNLFDQVLSRVENCRFQLESAELSDKMGEGRQKYDNNPCMRMYEAAQRLSREASVEELLGNLTKASQQYRTAGLLLNGVLLSCSPEDPAHSLLHPFSDKCLALSEACQERNEALY